MLSGTMTLYDLSTTKHDLLCCNNSHSFFLFCFSTEWRQVIAAILVSTPSGLQTSKVEPKMWRQSGSHWLEETWEAKLTIKAAVKEVAPGLLKLLSTRAELNGGVFQYSNNGFDIHIIYRGA